jgi:hypothetical protein
MIYHYNLTFLWLQMHWELHKVYMITFWLGFTSKTSVLLGKYWVKCESLVQSLAKMAKFTLTTPTGHFQWFCFVESLDLSYWHIYLGIPQFKNQKMQYNIFDDFMSATPTPAAWIWWTHAAWGWGVGGLAHFRSKGAIKAIQQIQ